MPWYKSWIQATIRGNVYIEASTEADAVFKISNATIQQALGNQSVRDTIQEKVTVEVVSITQQIPGVDYAEV